MYFVKLVGLFTVLLNEMVLNVIKSVRKQVSQYKMPLFQSL